MTYTGPEVNDALLARFTAVGLKVMHAPNPTLPMPISRSPVAPQAWFVSDMGPAGELYRGTKGAPGVPVVDPIRTRLLRTQLIKWVDAFAAERLREWLTVEGYADVMDMLGDAVEKWGYRRAYAGAAWGLQVALSDMTNARGIGYREMVRAVATLDEADVKPQMFYNIFFDHPGENAFVRAVNRSVFEVEHPGLHGMLVGDMFR